MQQEFEISTTDGKSNGALIFSGWADSLRQRMEQTESDISWHILVDPNAHAELPDRLHVKEKDFYSWPLYLNTYDAGVVALGPYMVKITSRQDFFKWVLAYLETVPIGIFVGCHIGFEDDLYEHLQQKLEYISSDNNQAIFRYYDPRMLYGLKTYRDQTVKHYMLNGVLFFEAWEPGRAESIFWEHPTGEPINFPENYTLPEELMEHLWKEAHIHSIIGGLGGEPGDILRSLSLTEAYHLIDESAAVIRNYGYNSYDDLVLCAAITAMSGTAIWDRNDILDTLRQNRDRRSLKNTLGGGVYDF